MVARTELDAKSLPRDDAETFASSIARANLREEPPPHRKNRGQMLSSTNSAWKSPDPLSTSAIARKTSRRMFDCSWHGWMGAPNALSRWDPSAAPSSLPSSQKNSDPTHKEDDAGT